MQWNERLKNMQEFDFFHLSPLTIDDQLIYSRAIKDSAYPVNCWSHNFSYLWSLTQKGTLYVYKGKIDGLIITFILTNGGRLYCPCLPFGKATREELVDVLIKTMYFCQKFNKMSRFSKSLVKPINEDQWNYLLESETFRQNVRKENLVGLERHYSISKLMELKGKEFENIRNKINRFNREYPDAIVRYYHNEDYDEVLHLGELWKETSGKKYKTVFDDFYYINLIKQAKTLNHIIIVIENEGKLIGMTSGEILPTEQAWGCMTKFDVTYKGLSEYLILEMVHTLHKLNPLIETMNVGSDLGKAGLTFYKEHFRPIYNFERYALHLK